MPFIQQYLQNSLCFLICGWATSTALAQQPPVVDLDERGRGAIEAFLTNSSKVREQDYGNVHFTMVETTIARLADGGNPTTVSELEYWARDNRYFRLDTKVVKSSGRAKVGQRERIIVEPDGYLKMFAASNDETLAVHDWGSTADGLGLLRGRPFIWAATRGYAVTDADATCRELLGEEVEGRIGERRLTGFTPANDFSQIEIRSHWNASGTSADSMFKCDVARGVVLHYQATLIRDSVTYSQTSEKSYDFERFGTIPARHVDAISYSTGGGSSHEYRVQRVSWEPTPLGIFSLEGQGFRQPSGSAVWMRRVVVFMIGVLLVFAALVIRRWQKAPPRERPS
jgi:hypothetical protein